MRRLSLSAIIFACAGLLAGPSGAAAEQLVMPHACGFEGERLVVRPAPARFYEILGPRDQQPFTTCQAGGQLCTTLMVHRFSIMCDGVQVPWMRVAAKISAHKAGRQWVESGRLQIVRPAAGSSAKAIACAEARQRGVQNRECMPWTATAPMERIQLPAGFAPLSTAGARIEVRSANAGPVAIEAAGPPEPVLIAGNSPQAATGTASGPAAAAQTKSADVKPIAPAGLRPPAGKVKPADWVTVIEAKDLSEVPKEAPARDQMLWIWLGGLGALGAIAFGLSRIPAERRGAITDSVKSNAMRGLSGVAERIAAVRSRQSAPESEDEVVAADDPALANAAWAAATLLDQIEQAVQGLESATPLRAVLEEELASIHQRLVVTRAAALDGGSPIKAAAQFRALIRELERVRRIANSAAASLSGARPVMAMPQSKSEAYQLLGVNADVSEGTLKKLVDALRMTWHPDHARDEQDRLLREDRIKQINIAWDLISDKRQAA